MTTPFDNGYEIATQPVQPMTDWNNSGVQCKTCKITSNCMLCEHKYQHLCFPRLQEVLVDTNVREKFLAKQSMSADESALHLYVDSMLYHLDNLPNANIKPMNFFERQDLRTDMMNSTNVLAETKTGAICRMFGRSVFDMLRSRGYSL